MKLYKFKDGTCCYNEKDARDYQNMTRCELAYIQDTTADRKAWDETMSQMSNKPMQNSYYYEL